jgi:Protein of unknown function (DUF1573)
MDEDAPMIARFACVLFLTALATDVHAGSGWAAALVNQTEHNWGTVERGAQLSHQFTITNTTGKDVRIKNVAPSCHCVSPMVTDYTIPPGGTSIIDAKMNTSGFFGSKTVTITVTFDRPRRGELQLRVSTVSSGGANVTSSEVDFGVATLGQKLEKKLLLDFTGAADRKIESVQFNKDKVTASYKELERTTERVRYELTLALPETLPPGQLEEKVLIKTNDPKGGETTVVAKARVEGQITMVPETFKLSQLNPGDKLTRNVIIKSGAPFRIVQVNNTLGMFAVQSGGSDKTVQMVSVTFTAPADAAGIPDHLEFLTSLTDGKPIVLPVVKSEK